MESCPHEVPAGALPHSMEHTSADAPPAVLQHTPPGSRRSSQSFPNVDLGGTYVADHFAVGIDVLSSGANPIAHPDSTRVHKRRRLGGASPSLAAPSYAVASTTYGALDVPFDPDMIANPGALSTEVDASQDGSVSHENMMFHPIWDGVEQYCCWWPSLPTFYAPVSQNMEALASFEPYHDVVPVPIPISQEYVSQEHIEPPQTNFGGHAASTPLATTSDPSAAAIELYSDNPLMAIREEAPLLNLQHPASNLQAADLAPVAQDTLTKSYDQPIDAIQDKLDSTSRTQTCPAETDSDWPGQHQTTTELQWPAVSVNTYQHNIIFDVVEPTLKTKRGPFKDEFLRQQTAETRNQKACIECARQRIRVGIPTTAAGSFTFDSAGQCISKPGDPFGPCMTCIRTPSVKMARIPCLRYRITDVQLSKTAQVPGYEWTRRWQQSSRKDINNWRSEDVKTIHISEGLSDTHMVFHVKEFVPQSGDKLERTWVHQGTRYSVPIPPYALTKLEDAKQAYQQHIVATESGALKQVLGACSPLVRETYEFAASLRHAKSLDEASKNLLDITFQLWMVVRFSTMSTWIVGDETLGMPKNILDTSPNPGRIPLPPVLGAQLDNILIHDFQENIRRKLLRQLDKAFRKYKHPKWLITYLVSFVLLHNAALITAHDAKYAQKHGMRRRFARESSVADYHKGATIILAHFHNCTRNHPFSERCKEDELKTLSKMTDDQIRFIRSTRVHIKTHEQEWERIREEGLYEHDFYFVSQLYQESWKPQTFSVEPSSSSSSEGSSPRSEFESSNEGDSDQ